MWVTLAAFLAVLAASQLLRWLNLHHLARHGREVPPGFETALDPEALGRAAAYARATARLDAVASALTAALVLWFFFGGGLGCYDEAVRGLAGTGLGAGVLFFLGLHWAQTALSLPFRAYRIFELEERHGFNTTTPRLWVADLLKAEAIATLLLAGLAGGSLGLLRWRLEHWWLWVWGLFVTATVLLQYLSPALIEPLFFRFESLRDSALAGAVRALAERAGVRVEKVLQVDASRRSRHANAYFAGIGRVKRVVLFDTLLERLAPPEVLAVLAHELGHWRLGHVARRVAASAALSLGGLFTASRLLEAASLPAVVGLTDASVAARIVILGFLAHLASFPLTPLASALSRRQERAADRFASRLTGRPGDLASALVALSRENLANLHPHPLYAWFHYGHPPLAERVQRLLRVGPAPGY
ncbi:MAG: M48 family metallopeptidase [Proteobacteria bacterium]|nr:M48 family metallopeptidase [Pseudomonadota bacterium]